MKNKKAVLKYKDKKIIDVDDWDNLVKETYGKPYSFQQQNGCQDRGTVNITIPYLYTLDKEMNDSIPEIINGNKMGVKFDIWLARNPEQRLSDEDCQESWCIDIWWERNFYPDLQTIANDLHKKGLIESGEYSINIDW